MLGCKCQRKRTSYPRAPGDSEHRMSKWLVVVVRQHTRPTQDKQRRGYDIDPRIQFRQRLLKFLGGFCMCIYSSLRLSIAGPESRGRMCAEELRGGEAPSDMECTAPR